MTEDKTYKIFMTHRFKLDPDYKELENMLKSISGFKFELVSHPSSDPSIDPATDDGIRELLAIAHEQIEPADCMVVIYADPPESRMWIQEEMEIAEHAHKPILGTLPPHHSVRPQYPQFWEMEMLPWDGLVIAEAIRSSVDEQAHAV